MGFREEKNNLNDDSFHMNETTELKEDTKVIVLTVGIKPSSHFFPYCTSKKGFCVLSIHTYLCLCLYR